MTARCDFVTSGTIRMYLCNTALWFNGSGARGISGFALVSANYVNNGTIRTCGNLRADIPNTDIVFSSDNGTTTVEDLKVNYFDSDLRKKFNVSPSDVDSLDIIDKIDFIAFDWKPEFRTGHQKVGVSAQQLQEIDPESVRVLPDGYLELNDNTILTHNAKATQQLSEKITILEEKKKHIQEMIKIDQELITQLEAELAELNKINQK